MTHFRIGIESMFKSTLMTLALLFFALGLTGPVLAEEDATMHQVFLAAESGKFDEAQAMMDKVLRDHPKSAKAHFVEAELLAKQGRFSNASTELNTAEQLQPELPFVKPNVLQNLKHLIASASNGKMQPTNARQSLPFNVQEWMPTVLWILGIGLVILLVMGFLNRRNAKMMPANSYAGGGVRSDVGQSPATGGMGSGLMSNLATGAALGVGVAAGEALIQRLIDGNTNPSKAPFQDTDSWNTASNPSDTDDMGGTDFGIADASSWDDDGGIAGDDDWT
jgi:tetratricopeptide (TPR) repeat protein